MHTPEYPHTVVLQVSPGLSASSPTETRHWISAKGADTKDRHQLLGQPLFQLLGNLMKADLHFCYLRARCLSSVCVCYLLMALSLNVPKGPVWLRVLVYLWSSDPLQGLHSFLHLPHNCPYDKFNILIWSSATVSVSCWVDPLNGQLSMLLCVSIAVYIIMPWIEACQ